MGSTRLLKGEELISKQNRIIKELPAKGLKEFSPTKSWIEKKQIEKKLEEKFDFISTERIEKSTNLSVAEWIPYLGKAKVLKKTGKLWETIGHHQDNEDWLLPEEILFLVENCELRLILDNVSASIEECYALLLQEELCSFDEYRVYSYLCRAGLRVIRHSPSVTVTPYEQQVNLDTIFQQCKRTPPPPSSTKPCDHETVVIDEISILSDSSEKETNDHPKKQNIFSDEIIEIEDDIEHSSTVEELLDSSNDSSDIVCISSPSYNYQEHSRLWYPRINQCLRRSMEKFIDLCNDDSPSDCKPSIHNKLDLIKFSKAKVLSLLPSAVNRVTVIHSPDSRLLPSNIVTKYSEYKVNLNIRSDYQASNYLRPFNNPVFRMPFTNSSHNSLMSPELMTSPLYRKAEEMQAMAMNMIQTASTLMSVVSSQNPNELWNFVDGRIPDMGYQPRYRDFQHQRPFCRFPRRNYRPLRRRNPYEKRFGGRYFKKPNEFNNFNDGDLHSTKEFIPEVKVETVVLSDDDDIDVKKTSFSDELSNSKRKRTDSTTASKKLKIESGFDSLFILEESSLKGKKHYFDISSESDEPTNPNINVNDKDDLKKENCDLVDCIEIDEATNKIQFGIGENNISRVAPTFEQNRGCRNFETEKFVETNKNDTPSTTSVVLVNIECNEGNKRQKDISKIQEGHIINPDIGLEEKNERNIQGRSCNNVEESFHVDLCKTNENKVKCNKKEVKIDITFNDEITSWEEYKNTNDSQLSVEEGDCVTILRFEDCSSYGNILNTLKIFKTLNSSKKRNKSKITYDVYLPGANFRKTLKVLPNFRVILLRSNEELPTPMDLQYLKTEYQDHIPFLFTVIFNETVGFYLCDAISLPTDLE